MIAIIAAVMTPRMMSVTHTCDAGMVISCSSPPERPSSALLQVFWVSEGCTPGLTHIPGSLSAIILQNKAQQGFTTIIF